MWYLVLEIHLVRTEMIQTASLELKKQNKKYALCTMCIGVGQGYAVVIENISL